MENTEHLLKLTKEEQRVLGSLIEKSKTTPDYYPMTVNSLIAACNQKTSRNPVVDYNEETVMYTLSQLKIKGLVSTVVGGTSRVTKYRHNLGVVYPLTPSDLSIVCLLLLRGALTPGEINTYSGRLYEFENIDEVNTELLKLASSSPAFVQQLEKRAGQKEARYVHLFEDINLEEEVIDTPVVLNPNANKIEELEARIAKLEEDVELLKSLLS